VPASEYWEKGCPFPIPGDRGIAVILSKDKELFVVTRQVKLPELERARDLGYPGHDRHPLIIPLVSQEVSRAI